MSATIESITPGPATGGIAATASRGEQGRLIDPRAQRFGAGMSVVVLVGALALDLAVAIPLLALALGVSALFGTRYFVLGRPWPWVRRLLRLAPPRELEHEFPPRFAQALGAIGFGLAGLLFLLGLPLLAWLVAGAVGALQTVLALTGYCLGCRLYFLRWWLPAQFARLARRTTLA